MKGVARRVNRAHHSESRRANLGQESPDISSDHLRKKCEKSNLEDEYSWGCEKITNVTLRSLRVLGKGGGADEIRMLIWTRGGFKRLL